MTDNSNPYSPPISKRRRGYAPKQDFDIETWESSKLTGRNWFINIVIFLNFPLIMFDLYLAYSNFGGITDKNKIIILLLVLVKCSMLGSLIGVWFLRKWAAIS